MDAVVVDTSVWVTYLRTAGAPEVPEVQRLIVQDRAVTVGAILAEIQQGARTIEDAARAAALLEPLRYLETSKEMWIKAGAIAATLRRRGETIPLTDVVIAATAMAHGAAVYSSDSHFARIPGLKLHRAR